METDRLALVMTPAGRSYRSARGFDIRNPIDQRVPYNMPLFRQVAIALAVSVLAVWAALPGLSGKGGSGTGDELITMAYHLANGDGFGNETKSRGVFRPTNSREPGYPFFVAIGFWATGTDLGALSDDCLRNGDAPCQDALMAARYFNLALMIATIVLTAAAAAYLCGGWWGIALAAALAIYWQGAAIHYSGRFMSENLILPAILLHAIFLARAIERPETWRWAILSGLALMVCVLTKAIFILYIGAGILAVVVLAAIPRVRRRPEYRQVVVIVLLGALAWGGWSMRNKLVMDDGRISGRGESILSWRAELSTATWPEIAAKAVYYTPYYGRDIAESIFSPETMEHLSYDDPGGMRKRVVLGTGEVRRQVEAFRGPKDIAKKWVPIRMILENWDKNLVLTPILIWRGFGMPTGHSWVQVPTVDSVIEIGSQILTVSLVPALAVALFVAWRRRQWRMVAFCVPFLFVVLAHAMLTHYRQRFGVPVIPGGVAALCWLAMLYLFRKPGETVSRD